MSLNLILLIGNAGRDAELRFIPSGDALASFSMAVSRSYQVNGEWKEETEWFNVSAWGRQAEGVSQRVRRGNKVFVEGRLSTRQYTTQSGETRTSLDVRAFRVMVINAQSDEDGHGSYGDHPASDQSAPESHTPPADSGGAPGAGFNDSDSDPGDLEDLPW